MQECMCVHCKDMSAAQVTLIQRIIDTWANIMTKRRAVGVGAKMKEAAD